MSISGIACETPEGILGSVPEIEITADQVIDLASQGYAVVNTPEIPFDWDPIMLNDDVLRVNMTFSKSKTQ